MPSITIQLDSAREAHELYNNDPSNLKLIQDQTGVKVTSRDGWIKLDGDQKTIERVEHLFHSLHALLKSGTNPSTQDITKTLELFHDNDQNILKHLRDNPITTSPRKPQITPKTIGQKKYLEAIEKHDVTFGTGPAGTGKTYLAVAMAVSALYQGYISRIILTRPAVEAGETLGFLPGDLREKLSPYLRPLHDALLDMMPSEEVQKNMEREVIEIAPLAYMRGRTLNNSFVILDESQNTTREQMFMFLTRLGHSSKAIITGDPTQTDLPSTKQSGLTEALLILQKTDGISINEFHQDDVVRHHLVRKIISAYESQRCKE
tara:strand:+ start:280 stop:1236 length:957 start_codon:yes stop_codon:yes gene_type:complete